MNSVLSKTWSIVGTYRSDPHVWGRAKQVAGGLLVADGLVGLENPLDGERRRAGIFSGLSFMVVGGVFVAASPWMLETQRAAPQVQSGTPASWLVYLFPALGVMLFLTGLRIVLVRAVTVCAGGWLLFSGSRQVKRYPQRRADTDVELAELREQVLELLGGRRRRQEVATAAATAQADGEPASPVLQQLFTNLTERLHRPSPPGAPGAPASRAHAVAPVAVAHSVVPVGWHPTADGHWKRYWDGQSWSAQAVPADQPVDG